MQIGLWRRIIGDTPVVRHAIAADREERGQQFAVDAASVPAEVFGLSSYADETAIAGRIDRKRAMQVPAVKRSRDLVAGTLGGLPLAMFGPDQQRTRWSLFEQPEPDTPRSVTMARTFEDMLFEGTAWWRVTHRDYRNYPAHVRRLEPHSVNVRKDGKVYVARNGQQQGMADEWVADRDLIRFDSPSDGLLIAGARAIRTCLSLDAAAANMAHGMPPIDYFTPAEGADPFDSDTEARDFLDDWQTSRRARSTGYVPAAVKYNIAGWTPEQLEMAEARQHAVLEIARLAGVDPEELGVSTTSRTYANQFDRRKAFLDFTLGQYRQAVEDRLVMTDVTPRGYYVRFDLDAFLRSDAKTRYEAYEIGKRVGAITDPEIREAEDKPPLSDVPASPEETPVAASDSNVRAVNFDTEPVIRLDAPGAQAFEVDVEKRTIKGLLVPYGKPAFSGGDQWQFSKGTLKYSDPSRVKLWIQHAPDSACGYAAELDDRDDGLYGTFKVARGVDGDKALSLAEDKVLDGFSIGLGRGGKFRLDNQTGVQHAIGAPLMETSLTPCPSYDDARVHAVAASAVANQKGNTMPCDKCGKVHAEGVVECQTEQFSEEGGPDFSAITDAIAKGFADLTNPQGGGPGVVHAGQPLEINEAPAYRFDGLSGEHDFSTDLIAYGRDGNSEAGERVMAFMQEQFSPKFDVDTGNVTTLNPAKQRPDMYVDERRFKTPLYDALYSGAITDNTPFVVPRFNSAADLVDDHVEGVEPTPGSFTATSQTITPAPVSGKVEITREVWDQGGNPQVSGLIWRKMVQHYYTALEAKGFTILDGTTVPAGQIHGLTTGATDDELVNEVEGVIVDLNFIAGGNTVDYSATHANLYKALAAAVDASGRKLLPQYGPTNANGQSRSKFASLDVAGTEFMPVPSLGAASTATGKSYLLDTESVHLWNSSPQRLQFEYRVAYVDLAIWGYVATAITDLAGVHRLDYDPAV